MRKRKRKWKFKREINKYTSRNIEVDKYRNSRKHEELW